MKNENIVQNLPFQDDQKRTLYVTVAEDADFHGETLNPTGTRDEQKDEQLDRSYILTLESESDLAHVFSPKSLELLRTIRRRAPASMREAARLVDRDIKQVNQNLNQLERLGIIEFEQQGRSKRPIVAFDEINAALDIDDESTKPESVSTHSQEGTDSDAQNSRPRSTVDSNEEVAGPSSERKPTSEQPDTLELPEGHFTQVEFPGGQAENMLFDSIHDPHLVYDFVRMLSGHIEDGIVGSSTVGFDADEHVESDERQMNAEIYTKAEVLCKTMQYVEEFGIYLVAFLRDDRPLVSSLTDTQVSEFYRICDDEDVGQYLATHGVSETYDERLQAVFGYQKLLNYFTEDDDQHSQSEEDTGPEKDVTTDGDDPREAEVESVAGAKGYPSLTEDEAEVLVDASLEALRSRIETIAQFYLEFCDLYNAIKHGTRIIPLDGFELSGGLAEEPISVNEQYVGALCKTSGDRDGGRPYFLYYPAERLVSRSLYVLEQTHGIFEYLQPPHRNAEREDDGQPLSVRFFASQSRVESDNVTQRVFETKMDSSVDSNESAISDALTALETGEYIQIGNADVKAIVPRSDAFRNPPPPTFAARLSLKGNTVVLTTELDEKPSEEYPVTMTYRQEHGGGARLSLIRKFSMDAEMEHLDFTQCHELDEINEAAKAGNLRFMEYDIRGGDTVREPLDPDEWSMSVPEMPFGRKLVSFLAQLELITQRHIPMPSMVFEEQLAVLRSERDKVDTRADAQAVLDRIEEIGAESVRTHVTVEGDGKRHLLATNPGTPAMTFTLPSGETRSVNDLFDGKQGSFSVHYEEFPGTPEWFIAYLRDHPDVATDVVEGSVPGNEASDGQFAVVTDIDLHVQTFWYDENRVVIRAETIEE